MPDLRLKMLYPRTSDEWSKRYNWPLWHEPEPADEYVMRQLHVCLDENQSEFDPATEMLSLSTNRRLFHCSCDFRL